MSDQVKFLLNEDDIPKDWYNIVADLPDPPAPVLHPVTGNAIVTDDPAPLFPIASIMQEVSAERTLDCLLHTYDAADDHFPLNH